MTTLRIHRANVAGATPDAVVRIHEASVDGEPPAAIPAYLRVHQALVLAAAVPGATRWRATDDGWVPQITTRL